MTITRVEVQCPSRRRIGPFDPIRGKALFSFHDHRNFKRPQPLVRLLPSASLPTAFAGPAPPLSETVAEEEYRIYDEVVRSKFLTTGTTLVVIERMTTNRLLPPDPERPELTTRTLFETQIVRFPASPELITDFLLTNHKPDSARPAICLRRSISIQVVER